MSNDSMISRLIENGFAFITFLIVIITFVAKVLSILERRMGEIVGEIKSLVRQQREDSDRLGASISAHDEHSQERHQMMMQALERHHEVALALRERLTEWRP